MKQIIIIIIVWETVKWAVRKVFYVSADNEKGIYKPKIKLK